MPQFLPAWPRGLLMASLDSLSNHIWQQIGPEGRELIRESWRLVHEFDTDLQPKVYACFLWATWLRGKGGVPRGRRDFWDRA